MYNPTKILWYLAVLLIKWHLQAQKLFSNLPYMTNCRVALSIPAQHTMHTFHTFTSGTEQVFSCKTRLDLLEKDLNLMTISQDAENKNKNK